MKAQTLFRLAVASSLAALACGPAFADAAKPPTTLCSADDDCSVTEVTNPLKAQFEKQDRTEFILRFDDTTTQSQFATVGKLPWLQKLDVGFAKNIVDITPLATLTSLRYLSLQNTSVSDIKALKGLASLATLDICNTEVTDLTPLAGKTNLETLSLPMTTQDFAPLKTCTGLKKLKTLGLGKDWSFLTSLVNFEDLQITFSALKDLNVIAGLTKLKQLDVAMNDALVDVSAIGTLTDLEFLNLSFDHIADISVVAKMPNLKQLHLYGTKVTSIAAVAKLTNLETIDLQLTAVKDLTPLLASSKTLSDLRVPAGTTEAQLAPFKKANPKVRVTIYKP